MSKTVTLRLEDKTYTLFRSLAKEDHRPLSNFIQTSALRYIESHNLVDDYEMDEIENNRELMSSLAGGNEDAKAGRGRFVE